jgi:lysozyme family protein
LEVVIVTTADGLAAFEDALKHTLVFEGGYANVPGDAGGETFRGITRRSHPDWPGWVLVEEAKRGAGGKASVIDAKLRGDQRMEIMVEDLYRRTYWDPLGGLPDKVRMKVFDIAVNAGMSRAVKLLQRALNGLGRGLAEDGKLGQATRGAAASSPEPTVLSALVLAQEAFYRNLVSTKPSNAKFLNGWLRRAAWKP